MQTNEMVKDLSLKYKQLKLAQSLKSKLRVVAELRKQIGQIEAMMMVKNIPTFIKIRQQIVQITYICDQIQSKANKQPISTSICFKAECAKRSEQFSREVTTLIVMKEIKSSDLKINMQEAKEIVNKIRKIPEIMKMQEEMINRQGENLDLIEVELDQIYSNVQEAGIEVEAAVAISRRTRRMKFRLMISGFFGALGYKIIGLPGMLMGFLFGLFRQ